MRWIRSRSDYYLLAAILCGLCLAAGVIALLEWRKTALGDKAHYLGDRVPDLVCGGLTHSRLYDTGYSLQVYLRDHGGMPGNWKKAGVYDEDLERFEIVIARDGTTGSPRRIATGDGEWEFELVERGERYIATARDIPRGFQWVFTERRPVWTRVFSSEAEKEALLVRCRKILLAEDKQLKRDAAHYYEQYFEGILDVTDSSVVRAHYRQGLQDDVLDENMKRQAVRHLEQIDDPGVVPIFRQAIRDRRLVECIVWALEKLGTEEARGLLLEIPGRLDVDESERIKAIGYLVRCCGEKGVAALKELLNSAEEPIRRAAQKALEKYENERPVSGGKKPD